MPFSRRIEPSLSPCGESGLKFLVGRHEAHHEASLPMRGEWIEITGFPFRPRQAPSLPMRGEWIEICSAPGVPAGEVGLSPCGESGLKSSLRQRHALALLSLPMRGEWIEIFLLLLVISLVKVSPHAGRVD